ncbi:MAG: phosphoribosylpyrophosphate synthetase [Cyclobacteriaceae bacterium]|nr:phosphoribosylpyrophosphate synthetase [Cyclobacteriaceae bacterium]
MKAYESLSIALNALQEKGYTHDFNLHPDCIECRPLKLQLAPEEFHVDEVHRFEGMTSPDDNSILFAISSTSGIKGVLVDAYGVYADAVNPAMIQKLRIDSQTNP